jgi:hypothetical protein
MKRIVFICFIILVISAAGFAQDSAAVKEVTGKVEIQQSGRWVTAVPGMVVPVGSVISTGFNSKARVTIGYSDIEIKPLTRMSIAEYSQTTTRATTSLDLKVGKVNAQVKSAEGVTHNFTLRSPSSTASVRGTEFVYDGYSVNVTEGTVLLTMSDTGSWEVVFAGEISGGETALLSDFDVESVPGGAPTTQGGGADSTGTLLVTFQ